ncbi:MAG: DUF2252 domain-containing protein [Acidobacteriaceae bacterium]
MARSAHSYVRGNTLKFYEWLQSGGTRSIPEGPSVWICGDCHLGNLGPVADSQGTVQIQIRDLDQTAIGNPAHDLIRLGLSLAMAARGSDLPGITTARMIEEMTVGYETGLVGKQRKHRAGDKSIVEPVRLVLKKAVGRKWKHLAQERIKDVSPTIPRGKSFWNASRTERSELESLFETDSVRSLVTCLRDRKHSNPIKLLDAAYWVKGCSSLGRLRYAVLLKVGDGDHRAGGLCLIDIKEAAVSAAPRSPDASIPKDNAERVVTGARQLSPHLGDRMQAASLQGRAVVLRELLPQDLKLELDELNCEQAIATARFLAEVVGRAHGRQMDGKTKASWRSELNRRRSKTLDAPSWLWSSVVDLVAAHEAEYLEHCRKYALESRLG